jgi:hypothetical protein
MNDRANLVHTTDEMQCARLPANSVDGLLGQR